MKITIAMDSFKGSMTSLQAGNAVKNGILKANDSQPYHKPLDIKVIPVADGGEGTVEALTYGRQVVKHVVTVTGPLRDAVQAEYIVVDEETAIIEMAQAAGLPLVPEKLRNPLYTTTYGVGQLILHAIDQGCRKFIVGIGGSATNDCGIGMLQALGYEFVYNGSKNVLYGAIALQYITQIIDHNADSRLKDCEFTIACDVDNPLVGDLGCSRVFSPQKGATSDIVEAMDMWMNSFANIVEDYVNKNADNYYSHIIGESNKSISHSNNRYTPGAGAAGGMGYAFLMFLGGRLMSGAQIVIEHNHIEEEIIGSNFVITGEGKLDCQSSMGKLPTKIAELAKEHGKKVIAIAGVVDEDFTDTGQLFYRTYQIDKGHMYLKDAMITDNAITNLERTVANIWNEASAQ